MRAGVVCAGAVAVAAMSTAALIQFELIGPKRPTPVAAAPAAQPAPIRQARQIGTSRPAEPAPVIVQPAAPPAPPPEPAVASLSAPPAMETTGSIGDGRPVYVNGSRVALRAAPDAKAKIVDRMSDGQKLMEMSRSGEWVRVRFAPSGAEGWVNGAYVAPSPAKRQ